MVKTLNGMSVEQATIKQFTEEQTGNILVQARAGTGKSTLIDKIAPQGSVILCFGRAPADEMQERIAGTLRSANTFHSFGKNMIEEWDNTAWFSKARAHWAVLDEFFGGKRPEDARDWTVLNSMKEAISWLKQMGVFPDDPQKTIDRHLDDPRFECEEDILPILKERARPLLQRLSGKDKSKKGTLYRGYDIDDMQWFPLIYGLGEGCVDNLYVDECQDLNPIRTRLALQWGKRITGVGDPAQAIFAFQGSTPGSMSLLQEACKATMFPLSVCWRCPSSHIAWAQELVPDIVARPGAPEGEINDMEEIDFGNISDSGALILCRNNAPLVRQFYRARKDTNHPVYMMGRGFVESLKFLAGAEWEARKPFDKDRFEKRVESRMKRARNALAAQAVEDNANALREMLDANPDLYLVGDIHNRIDADFTAPKTFEPDAIKFSTIHSAKGLEHEHVIWYGPELVPNDKATEPWELEQERNLDYVARTRSKLRLDRVPTK